MISCGKRGPIYPPLIQKPQKIESFSAFQRGRKIILEWINPTTYTDGEPLDVGVGEVEIWLAAGEETRKTSKNKKSRKEKTLVFEEKMSENKFLREAGLHLSLKKEELPEYLIEKNEGSQVFQYHYRLRDEDFIGRTYTFGLRIRDTKRRKSDFSIFLTVRPQVLPLPPRYVSCEVRRDHIFILWDVPSGNIDGSSPAKVKGYNVYRRDGDLPPRRLNRRLIDRNRFRDTSFDFGETYHYFVRASATESSPFLQSSDSEVVEIEAKDTFPPHAPKGLVMIRGEDFISLSWEESPEKDLAGYRVWRKEKGEEEYGLLTPEAILENTFTDRDVGKNKTYVYRITALDGNGNESEMSESISDIIEDGVR
jgi:hypothetical protein